MHLSESKLCLYLADDKQLLEATVKRAKECVHKGHGMPFSWQVAMFKSWVRYDAIKLVSNEENKVTLQKEIDKAREFPIWYWEELYKTFLEDVST